METNNLSRALSSGKLPFLVSNGTEKRYVLASSLKQCQLKFKGWNVERVTHEEYTQYWVTRKELINQIYDTLMGNVGMTKFHTGFPVESISNQSVQTDFMYFELDGRAYKLYITEVPVMED